MCAFNSTIDSLYQVTQEGKDEEKAKAFYQLCIELNNKQPTKAINYANKGLSLAYQTNQIELQAKLHYQIGYSYMLIPDYTRALVDLKKGIAITEDINDLALCGQFAYQLGKINYNIKEQEQAVEYTQKSIKCFQSIESLNDLANSYNLLALIYNSIHQNSKGLEFLVKAVDIAEKSGNNKSLANIYVNIGNSFSKQGKYDKALEHHQKALEIAEEANYPKAISVALNNIGDIYITQQEYRLAKAFFTRSIEMDKTPHKRSSSAAYNNIGEVYLKLEQPHLAQEYYQKSIEISTRNFDENGKAKSHINLGKMYFQMNNYSQSIKHLNKSLKIGNAINDIFILQDANEYLAKNYEAKFNYKKSYNYLKTFHAINDSIDQLRQQNKIDELQLKYDIKQKEKTIDALMKKRTIDKLKMLNDKNINTIYTFVIIGVIALLIFLFFAAYLLYSRYTESKRVNEKLTEQNTTIDDQRNKILGSINYAKRIQNSILISEDDIKHIIPKSFVFYEPRDIVSGDLYWIKRLDQKIVVAAIDCTGHGVPGAFLTLIANMLLKRIVEERKVTNPSEILTALDEGMISTLKQDQGTSSTSDGMDISICVIDETSRTIEYAGAMNPVFVVQSHQLTALQPNIASIGGKAMRPGTNENKTFKTHKISYTDDTSIYMLSDGYVDQFGGPKNSKFNTNRFKEMILNNYQKDMSEQKEIVRKTLLDWQGDQRQIDDILVIGLRL